MKHYAKEFKANIIARMLPPNNVGVPQLAQKTGVPKDTLYTWRIKHRKRQGNNPAPQIASGKLSSEEKFTVVIESASLNEVDLNQYCRRKGLYSEQIQVWRKACMQANAPMASRVDNTRVRVQARQLQQLEADPGRTQADPGDR